MHPVFESESPKSSLLQNLSALQNFVDIRTQIFDSWVTGDRHSNAECADNAFPLIMVKPLWALGLPTILTDEFSFLWAIFHLQHVFAMISLPAQTIRETSSQNQRTTSKFSEISGRKNILKKFQNNSEKTRKILKKVKISRNYEKVPENPTEGKLASLIFGNNFELHSHNGFRPKSGSEHPPTCLVDTAQ